LLSVRRDDNNSTELLKKTKIQLVDDKASTAKRDSTNSGQFNLQEPEFGSNRVSMMKEYELDVSNDESPINQNIIGYQAVKIVKKPISTKEFLSLRHLHNSSETGKDDNRLMQSRLDKLKDIRKQKNTN
jgi:hypothetical protein